MATTPPLSEVVGFEDTSYFLHFPSIPALHLQNTANIASNSRKVLYSAQLWGGKLPPHSFVLLCFTAGLLYYGQYHKNP